MARKKSSSNEDAKRIAQEIMKGAETQAMLAQIAGEIADEATRIANMTVGKRHLDKGGRPIPAEYGTQVNVGRTRARGYIWAKNGTAIHAERKDAILPEVASAYGPGKVGKPSKGKSGR